MQKHLITRILSSTYIGWIMLFFLVLIWGTSFILIKRGLEVYTSVEVGGIRIFVSFLVLLPFALKRIFRISKKNLKHILIIGVIGTGIPAFLFALAQTHINSSTAGILNSLTPLFTMLAGFLFFKQKLRWTNVTGVLMGLLGAIGLIYATNSGSLQINFLYAVLIVIATMLYAIQSNMIKYFLNDVPPISIASVGFFFIGIPVGIVLFFFTDFTTKLIEHENGLHAFLYVALLGFFASAVAIVIYNKLVQTTNAVFASSVTYFVPVLALVWGLFDGERFPLPAYLFSGLILAGMLLVNKRTRLIR
ncbi:MAG: EamA family transporter [Bacteroidales bacterium]|nr:EamA family transporter [Bacteroidales bacterium]